MSKFGGGGSKCTICDKTAYPAETIQFEKMPYHVDCFKCSNCDRKMEGAAKAAQYEGTIYCLQCFQTKGFAQKQRSVKWVKKEAGTGGATSSKFGGGGSKCKVCDKTVYAAETVSFEKMPYHADCFKCKTCDKKLTPAGAAQYEDDTYCTKCFADGGFTQKQAKSTVTTGKANAMASRFGGGGSKCTVCDKTVYAAETVSFEKKPYHADCFKCKKCDKKLSPAGAAQYESDTFCLKCFKEGGYTKLQASTTKTTGKTNAMASRFGGGGTKCFTCNKTVYAAETLLFEKQPYHPECFKCKNCDKKMESAAAANGKKVDNVVDIYCKKCWGELGLNRADA